MQASGDTRIEPVAADADRQVLSGIGLMLAAMTIVPMMDAVAKYLSAEFATLQIVWARYFFHFLFLVPLVTWRYGRRAFISRRPLMQLLRGSLLAASTWLFFAAIARMPLADAIATIFIYPFIVTALSPVVLGEPVGIRRWLAVTVGFIGALIVIRPTGAVMNEGVLLALAAGARTDGRRRSTIPAARTGAIRGPATTRRSNPLHCNGPARPHALPGYGTSRRAGCPLERFSRPDTGQTQSKAPYGEQTRTVHELQRRRRRSPHPTTRHRPAHAGRHRTDIRHHEPGWIHRRAMRLPRRVHAVSGPDP